MKLSDLKSAWFKALERHFTSIPEYCDVTVIFAEEIKENGGQGPRPQKPYITLKFDGPRFLSPADRQRWSEQENSFVLSSLEEYTLSIQAFGSDAADILGGVSRVISGVPCRQTLMASKPDIAVINRGDIIDITEQVDTGWEQRVAMDVIFYATSKPTKVDTGAIEKVQWEGDFQGSDEIVISGETEKP